MATNRLSKRRPSRSSNSVQELYAQASAIGHELIGLGGLVRDAAQEKVADLKDNSSAVYEQLYSKGQGKLRHWSKGVEDYIKEQPFKSMMIAAAVGLLFGKIVKRR